MWYLPEKDAVIVINVNRLDKGRPEQVNQAILHHFQDYLSNGSQLVKPFLSVELRS
jgi:hypothetical protein